MSDSASSLPLPDGLAPVGAPPDPRPGEILAIFLSRNEALRLPAALAHAKRLGVDRVIVIDNGSTDGSRAMALAAGAHLIDAPGSYAGAHHGIAWVNAVADRWARGHWVMVADADELLVYPGSDRADLKALCAHLDSIGSEVLRTVLLDFFPGVPLDQVNYQPGQSLLEAAPFFEPPPLRQERIDTFPYEQDYGGIRERLFFPEMDPSRWQRRLHLALYKVLWRLAPLRQTRLYQRYDPGRSPTATKLPLIRWREGAALLSSCHQLAPMRMAPSQPSGVLMHFKFLQDFHARAVDAVRRKSHYDSSREYRRYLAKLDAVPGFTLHGPRSMAYAGPEQLVQLGLMRDTPAWAAARAGAEAASDRAAADAPPSPAA
jgi:hypothetical protein